MKTTLILAALCGLVAGCGTRSPVPNTKFSGTLAGQQFEFEGHKQTEAKGLELTINVGATNFHLHIDELSAKNDPMVISKSYAGQVAVEKARWEGINNLANSVAKGIVEGGGKAIMP